MAETSFWVSAALATIPLSGVVGGFIAQTLIAGRNVYINSITTERSKWLEKLRSNLSAFHAGVEAASFRARLFPSGKSAGTSVIDDKDVLASAERLDTLAATLRLQLNPDGLIDGNVAIIVDALSRYTYVQADEFFHLQDLLIEHSQWLLKAEWEKVKWEARGSFHRFKHRGAAKERDRRYAEWASKEGSYTHVLTALAEKQKKP